MPTFGRPTNAIAGGSSSSAAMAASQRAETSCVVGPGASPRRRRRRPRRPRPRRPGCGSPTTYGSGLARAISFAQASASSSRALRAISGLALGRQRPHDRVQQVGDARGRGWPRSRTCPPSRRRRTPRRPARASGCRPCWRRRAPASSSRRSSSAASRSAGVGPVSASTRNTMTSASLIARRAWSWTCSSIGSPGRDLQPARVHDHEPAAVPLGVAVQAVPGRPRAVLDDRRARVPDDPVEQRALADVGPPDEGDDRQAGGAGGHGSGHAGGDG